MSFTIIILGQGCFLMAAAKKRCNCNYFGIWWRWLCPCVFFGRRGRMHGCSLRPSNQYRASVFYYWMNHPLCTPRSRPINHLVKIDKPAVFPLINYGANYYNYSATNCQNQNISTRVFSLARPDPDDPNERNYCNLIYNMALFLCCVSLHQQNGKSTIASCKFCQEGWCGPK